MAAKHIPGADGWAKLGWAEGRQELGPEAARSGAAPSARQGPTAAGWRASRLAGEFAGELIS